MTASIIFLALLTGATLIRATGEDGGEAELWTFILCACALLGTIAVEVLT